jgi:hypothetical protein
MNLLGVRRNPEVRSVMLQEPKDTAQKGGLVTPVLSLSALETEGRASAHAAS